MVQTVLYLACRAVERVGQRAGKPWCLKSTRAGDKVLIRLLPDKGKAHMAAAPGAQGPGRSK